MVAAGWRSSAALWIALSTGCWRILCFVLLICFRPETVRLDVKGSLLDLVFLVSGLIQCAVWNMLNNMSGLVAPAAIALPKQEGLLRAWQEGIDL